MGGNPMVTVFLMCGIAGVGKTINVGEAALNGLIEELPRIFFEIM